MTNFLESIGFIFFWLIWVILTPFVALAMVANAMCNLCSRGNWKPWINFQ